MLIFILEDQDFTSLSMRWKALVSVVQLLCTSYLDCGEGTPPTTPTFQKPVCRVTSKCTDASAYRISCYRYSVHKSSHSYVWLFQVLAGVASPTSRKTGLFRGEPLPPSCCCSIQHGYIVRHQLHALVNCCSHTLQ